MHPPVRRSRRPWIAPPQLNEEASDKVLAIEQQYSSLRRPIYKQRGQLLKEVSMFWARTIMNHPTFRDRLTTDDEAILAFLREVQKRRRQQRRRSSPPVGGPPCMHAPYTMC